MTTNANMKSWIGMCPQCGPVRIESAVEPVRCSNTRTSNKLPVRCRENLTYAFSGKEKKDQK